MGSPDQEAGLPATRQKHSVKCCCRRSVRHKLSVLPVRTGNKDEEYVTEKKMGDEAEMEFRALYIVRGTFKQLLYNNDQLVENDV